MERGNRAVSREGRVELIVRAEGDASSSLAERQRRVRAGEVTAVLGSLCHHNLFPFTFV
jgi:hypothetical protein